MQRNIKLLIEYDGTNYCGWQIQSNAPTIQQCLQQAIYKITSQQVHIQGSGRTDSGVHAWGQVANFKTESKIPGADFAKAINSQLPLDIIVKKSQEVAIDFHSQYDSKAKTYSYRIFCSPTRPAVERNYVHWVRHSLDIDLMREAKVHLLGTHDFSSFESANSPRKSSTRTVNSIDIEEKSCYIEVKIQANGFLYKMVRNIVGTLIEVGGKEYSPNSVKDILEARDRKKAGKTAPAKGLFLEEVIY